MKNFTFLFFLVFLFFGCSDNAGDSKKSTPDERYQINKVSFLLPKKFVKVEDRVTFIKKMESEVKVLNPTSQVLWNEFLQFREESISYFVNFSEENFEYISFDTQHPLTLLNDETTNYLLDQYESSVAQRFPDPSFKMKRLQSKLGGVNAVRYFKYKYNFEFKDAAWSATNYLVYANSRIVAFSIKSADPAHQDLEKYLQFIQIEK